MPSSFIANANNEFELEAYTMYEVIKECKVRFGQSTPIIDTQGLKNYLVQYDWGQEAYETIVLMEYPPFHYSDNEIETWLTNEYNQYHGQDNFRGYDVDIRHLEYPVNEQELSVFCQTLIGVENRIQVSTSLDEFQREYLLKASALRRIAGYEGVSNGNPIPTPQYRKWGSAFRHLVGAMSDIIDLIHDSRVNSGAGAAGSYAGSLLRP